MPEISIQTGNIFMSRAQTIVNTVNCVGVMGAGIALECRLRYPQMYEKYQRLCAAGAIDIGKLWLYKPSAAVGRRQHWILNFPTKRDWKHPSRLSYIRDGLVKFEQTYRERGIESIAFPVLGAQNGGLRPDESIALMTECLARCDIPVEIYRYDPNAPDDRFDEFRRCVDDGRLERLLEMSGAKIRASTLGVIKSAVLGGRVVQLNQLAELPGVGPKTLETVYRLSCGGTDAETAGGPVQDPLF
jgi:O-acetyl-ADP-ribose deacetylase (regulator of RNase III)